MGGTVAVLRLQGAVKPVMGNVSDPGLNTVSLAKAFKKLKSRIDSAAVAPRAIALQINCPGGAPAQCSLIVSQIEELCKPQKIPCLAFCEDVAASGGYWLACAAERIYVQPATLIGSIGVIQASFGLDKAIEHLHITRRVKASGPLKGMGDPFSPETAAQSTRRDALMNSLFEEFKTHVRQSRGDRLQMPEEQLFSGGVWTGREAVAAGIADEIGTLEPVCRQLYGKNTDFLYLSPTTGLFSSFSSRVSSAVISSLEDRALWLKYGL
jgi:serine protease SohB